MSLRIIKAGIADTIQDLGRYGWQYIGINPTGAILGLVRLQQHPSVGSIGTAPFPTD